MSRATCFWIVMLVWALQMAIPWSENQKYRWWGNGLVLLILLLLLGWQVFNAPLHG
jgi:hypothetical protein